MSQIETSMQRREESASRPVSLHAQELINELERLRSLEERFRDRVFMLRDAIASRQITGEELETFLIRMLGRGEHVLLASVLVGRLDGSEEGRLVDRVPAWFALELTDQMLRASAIMERSRSRQTGRLLEPIFKRIEASMEPAHAAVFRIAITNLLKTDISVRDVPVDDEEEIVRALTDTETEFSC